MSRIGSTWSASSKSSLNNENLNMVNFYEKKFDESRKKDDRYKEKIEKHLKNLASDRLELEDEVLRRGEKISDLQKALVDLQLSVFEERERFLKVCAENEELKKSEEQLHSNVRDLLSMTRQKDLKDQIIYILNKPRVEIGINEDVITKSGKDLLARTLLSKKLSKEVESLKSQLDEVLKVSQSKTDLILQECREALEKSKEQILQDKQQFLKLQKSLSRTKESESSDEVLSMSNKGIYTSTSNQFSDINSFLKSMHMSLVLLSKVITKTSYCLNTIQTTKIYHRMLNISDIPTNIDVYADETVIEDLEACLRQCTRLSFDINNVYKSLNSYLTKNNLSVAEFRCLGDLLNDLTASSAETDLLGISLKRHNFFEVLKGDGSITKESRAVRQIDDFKKMVENVKAFSKMANELLVLVEGMSQVYKRKSEFSHISVSQDAFSKPENVKSSSQYRKFTSQDVESALQGVFSHHGVKSTQSLGRLGAKEKVLIPQRKAKSLSEDLIHLSDIYQRTMREAESLGFGATSETELLSKKIEATQRMIDSSANTYPERMDSQKMMDFGTNTYPERSVRQRMVDSGTNPERKSSQKKMDSGTNPERKSSQKMMDSGTNTERKSLQKMMDSGTNTERKSSQKMMDSGTNPERKSSQKMMDSGTNPERMVTQKMMDSGTNTYNRTTNSDKNIYSERMTQTDLLLEMVSQSDLVLNEINRALSRVENLEKCLLTEQDPRCLQLAEKIKALHDKFRELVEDINMQSMQEQLSTYSQTTLKKLKELAEQSRNAVIAAESQVASHRSNAKAMSQKLLETEELLQESINECLSLKQRMKRDEEKRDMERLSFVLQLRERIDKVTTGDEIREMIEDIMAYLSDGDRVGIVPQVDPSIHSQGHEMCDKKIKDLKAEERKARTELKLLQEDMKNERTVCKHYRVLAEKSSSELNLEKDKYKKLVESLESKNASLMEQLKVERKRIQNRERFHRSQIEGCNSDIRNLKTKIRDLERQLVKAVMVFESSSKDVALLKTVHATAQHSKEATAAIRRLKAKLYELENEIKAL